MVVAFRRDECKREQSTWESEKKKNATNGIRKERDERARDTCMDFKRAEKCRPGKQERRIFGDERGIVRKRCMPAGGVGKGPRGGREGRGSRWAKCRVGKAARTVSVDFSLGPFLTLLLNTLPKSSLANPFRS